jgi:hypothetical protein
MLQERKGPRKDRIYKNHPKLESHPDRDEIVERIKRGESPTYVAQMLRKKYPGDSALWLTRQYLYRYRISKHPEVADVKRDVFLAQSLVDVVPDKSEKSPVKDDKDIATRIMELTGQEPRPPDPRVDIPDELLLKWCDGLTGFQSFVEDMIIERGERVKLQDYQIKMANLFLTYAQSCIVAGGQIGKDFMMQNFILWWGLTHAGSIQLVLCSTQAQTSALKSRIEDKIAMSGELHFAYAKSAERPVPVITLKNGSQMLFLTAKSKIAGYTAVDIVWINEARFITDVDVARVSPLLGIGGGKMMVLSRPLFRKGFFWDFYRRIPQEQTMKIPTDWNIHFNKDVIENDRKTMSPHLFKADYMAEFADAGSSFFSDTAIDYCSDEEYEIKAMVPEKGYEYSLGIDPARLRDISAMIVTGKKINFNPKKGEFEYKLAHVHGFNPDLGPADFQRQYAYIRMLDNSFRLKYIVSESTGMGGPYTERLQDEWREAASRGEPVYAKIDPYDTSGLIPKISLYDWARGIIDTRNIKLARNAHQLNIELKMTQFGVSSFGRPKIETPVTDDYADALCLSLMAFKKPFEVGIGIVKRKTRQPFWV